ncbi:MAG: hypothetical protein AB7Q00_03045 [Phycisphaerales bacterium]
MWDTTRWREALKEAAALKTTRRGANLLVLSGLPHGVGWPIFAVVLALGLPTFFWFLEGKTLMKPGFHFQWIPAGVIVLLCTAFLIVGVKSLLDRERLTLDRATGRGTFETWNILGGKRKRHEFDLTRVVEVRIDVRTEATPGGGKRGGGTMRVFEATIKPGKKIVLDTTSNGRDERVRRVAKDVAEFLGVPLRTTDRSGTREEDTETVEEPGEAT